MEDLKKLTTKARLENVEARLTGIEEALELRPPQDKKGFLAKKWEWLINHKGTSSILGIILCLTGLFGSYYLNHKREWWNEDVDGRVELDLNKAGGVKSNVAEIGVKVEKMDTRLQTLQPFIEDVIKHQFENASKLPTALLRDRLPAIQHLMVAAETEHVQIDPAIIHALGAHLSEVQAKSPNSHQVWPVVSKFINYRSDQLLPDSPKILSTAITGCIAAVGNVTLTIKMENCEIDLDDLADFRIPNGLYPRYLLINTVVRYKGGPIRASAIIFQNCVFRFDVPSLPAREGILVMRDLTTAPNQGNISFQPS